MRVPSKEKRLVWVVSGVLGALLGGTAVLNIFYLKAPLIFRPDDLLFLALIVSMFPPAVVNLLDGRWKASIDRHIPEFLRDLSEAGRTGVTLTRAIELSAQRKYGPLSSELQRVVALLSWGRSLDDALREFAERVDTRLARRTAILISEINRSGGDIQEVLEAVSRHIGELQTIEMERKSMIRPYIAIVYIAFFIFIFIDILLIRTLFTQLQSLQSMVAEGGGGLFIGSPVELSRIQLVMFHLTLIEGFYGGLAAGKMGEGSMGAGLKHSLIMMALGFLAFFFLVWHPIM
jgi:flagellar protein FlaJ